MPAGKNRDGSNVPASSLVAAIKKFTKTMDSGVVVPFHVGTPREADGTKTIKENAAAIAALNERLEAVEARYSQTIIVPTLE